MNLWMKILLSFSFVFSISLFACDFKSEVKTVYSLSGPVTTALKEYGLLRHPKLKGISYFYPADEKDFSGKIIPGGVFLSPTLLQEFQGAVVFYDDSEELKKTFSRMSEVKSREMLTRNLLPHEVTNLVTRELDSIVQNCHQKKASFIERTKDTQQKIVKLLPELKEVVFYLGEMTSTRPPELIIANDGVVKWLRQEKKIKTYPSQMAYVNWSAKIMQQMSGKVLKVGIKDSGREKTKQLKKISPFEMTLIYPGALTPGLDQLEAILYWLENL